MSYTPFYVHLSYTLFPRLASHIAFVLASHRASSYTDNEALPISFSTAANRPTQTTFASFGLQHCGRYACFCFLRTLCTLASYNFEHCSATRHGFPFLSLNVCFPLSFNNERLVTAVLVTLRKYQLCHNYAYSYTLPATNSTGSHLSSRNKERMPLLIFVYVLITSSMHSCTRNSQLSTARSHDFLELRSSVLRASHHGRTIRATCVLA